MIQLYDYQQELYEKTLDAFRNGYRRPLVVAPCGAGKSYLFAKMVEKANGPVLILTHRRELMEQHKKLLTDLGVLSQNARISMILTEVKHLGEYPTPKFLILDEAHLSRSNSWVKVIEYYDTRCIGFTATPIRLDGKPLGDIYDVLIDSVSTQWLIDNRRLAPYDYYAPTTVNVEGAKHQAGDFITSDLEQIMMDRAIYSDVIQSWEKFAKGYRTIVYCVSVKHARETAEAFNNAGYIADYISASRANRDEIFERFRKGKLQVLCNVGIISEGVSITDVQCCVLLRPTESHALYWQQAMRCMRYAPEKRAVILDCVGNYTRNPMPDEAVHWSLTKKMSKKQRFDENGNFTIRVCPNCFKTFKTAPVCPYCHAVYPLNPKEIQKRSDIGLEQITKRQQEKLNEQKKELRQEVGRARSFPELMKIAKERGYNTRWVYIQMKLKGIAK